jgi:type IV pilus assembly protein PilE
LIELVVVIIVIGILASIALPTYTDFVERSRITEAYTNLKAILEAEKRYALEFDAYGAINSLDANVTGRFFTYALGSATPPQSNNENLATATRTGSSRYSYTVTITELSNITDTAPF